MFSKLIQYAFNNTYVALCFFFFFFAISYSIQRCAYVFYRHSLPCFCLLMHPLCTGLSFELDAVGQSVDIISREC